MADGRDGGNGGGLWAAAGVLPDGPLDLVGDIHGEIDALNALLGHLGYSERGGHPADRRLVFVGDLIDRGPDSLATVRRVAELVSRGRAVAVMGNHDLAAVAEQRSNWNAWLFGHGEMLAGEKRVETDSQRREVLDFLRRLPVAVRRHGLRVVHACWDKDALAALKGEPGPADALRAHRRRIKQSLPGDVDPTERTLALQNRNPMRLITSGPEVRAAAEFFAGGRVRRETRHPWWEEYASKSWVVFGHYWRIAVAGVRRDEGFLSRHPLHTPLGSGRAMCIDYSVGARWFDRSQGRSAGPFTGRLAALRWPERELVFDDGERLRMPGPDVGEAAVHSPFSAFQ